MKIVTKRIFAIALALVAMSAESPPATSDLVRQGNLAFDRGDYRLALDLYARAEERTPDPGQVSFNEGSAYYHLGRYREAELAFRRCREDAEGERLARLLYNLANCLVRQEGRSDVRRLREAVGLFEQCIEHDGAAPELKADARHNLELSRLLLQKARSRKEGADAADDEPERDPPTTPDRKDDQGSDDRNPGAARPDASGKPERLAGDRDSSAAPPQPPPPGKGNLPQVPDEDELAAMSSEDAAQHLKLEAARIRQDQQEHRQRPIVAVGPKVPDW